MAARVWIGAAAVAATAALIGASQAVSVPVAAPVAPATSVQVEPEPWDGVRAAYVDGKEDEHLAQAPVEPAAAPADPAAEQAQAAAAAAAAAARPLPGAPSPKGQLGIPRRVLQAYQASSRYGHRCGLAWQVVAAVGLTESGHAGGGKVFDDGVTWEPILGPVLDGRGFPAIRDSDGGVLDGDPTWDRAVGPMQFIPATWRWIGVDADRSGTADPHDVDDAAATTARYLCSYGADLRDPVQLKAALLRYNNSQAYADRVLEWAQAYGARIQPTADPAPPPGDAPVTAVAPAAPAPSPAPAPSTLPSPTPTGTPDPTPDPTAEPSPDPSPDPTVEGTTEPAP